MPIIGNVNQNKIFPKFEGYGDGVTDEFALGFEADNPSSVDAYVGGSIQVGTYTLNNNVIKFVSPPNDGEFILVKAKTV